MAIFNSYVKLLEGTSIHKSRNPEIGWSTGMLVIWALRMVDKLRCCCKIQAQAELDGKMWSGGKSDGNPHDFLPDLSARLMNTCFCMSSALIKLYQLAISKKHLSWFSVPFNSTSACSWDPMWRSQPMAPMAPASGYVTVCHGIDGP